jgi:phytanoyl-CoA hydroxylase
MLSCAADDVLCVSPVDEATAAAFSRDGFTVFPACVFRDGPAGVALAVSALEDILNGVYDTGCPPSKQPAVLPSGSPHDDKVLETQRDRFVIGPSTGAPSFTADGMSSEEASRSCLSILTRRSKPATLQIINTRFASRFLDAVCRSPSLGKAVAALCGWPGVRLAQDQAWLKPPGSGPLSFHRDTTYFDFSPKEVCTVWFSFDDLQAPGRDSMGPLEYCVGSHLWGDCRRGSANQFFDADYKVLCRDAWLQHLQQHNDSGGELGQKDLAFHAVAVAAGGISIHNGRTWHGSGPNKALSSVYRKGLGVHFIRSDAVFQSTEPLGKMWAPYKKGGAGSSDFSLPDDVFPITWAEQKRLASD